MGYDIIFDSMFARLSDGRLLHLERSGCNNDDAGRSRYEFRGKFYTDEELQKRAESFMKDGNTSQNDLKIRSKWCSWYQYGEHLLRMAKRATPLSELMQERRIQATRYDGLKVFKQGDNEGTIITGKEAEDWMYDAMYGRRPGESYLRLTSKYNTADEIVKVLEKDNGKYVELYVGKGRPRLKNQTADLTSYWYVEFNNGKMITGITSRRLQWNYSGNPKKFKTEKEANKWLKDRDIERRYSIECRVKYREDDAA